MSSWNVIHTFWTVTRSGSDCRCKKAYAACRASVETELIRQPAIADGMDGRHGQPGSNGHQSGARSDLVYRRKQRTATPGQLCVIHGIAARCQIDLDPILNRGCDCGRRDGK